MSPECQVPDLGHYIPAGRNSQLFALCHSSYHVPQYYKTQTDIT